MAVPAWRFLEPPSTTASSLEHLLPSSGGRHAFRILPASISHDDASSAVLRGWKRLCDELLPALRSRGHLHNLIYRHKVNASIVLCREEDNGREEVLGGATFRIVHGVTEGTVVLDVLLLAVAQRPGVCGQGHATRLVNSLKFLLLRRAAALGASPLLLTQADLGEQALAFWARQGLRDGAQATALLQSLSSSSPKEHIVYDYTMPMVLPLSKRDWRCDERPSVRAQALNEDEEEAEVEAEPVGHDCRSAQHATPAGMSILVRSPVCRVCGLGEQGGEMLRCDMCSRWCHQGCAAGSRGVEGEAPEAMAESLVCRMCAVDLSKLRIGPPLRDTAADGINVSSVDAASGGGSLGSASSLFDALASHVSRTDLPPAEPAVAVTMNQATSPAAQASLGPPLPQHEEVAPTAAVGHPPAPPVAPTARFGGAFPSRATVLEQRQRASPQVAPAPPAETRPPAVKAELPPPSAAIPVEVRHAKGNDSSSQRTVSDRTVATALWHELLGALVSAYPHPQAAAAHLRERAAHRRGAGSSVACSSSMRHPQGGFVAPARAAIGSAAAAAAALADASAMAMQRVGVAPAADTSCSSRASAAKWADEEAEAKAHMESAAWSMFDRACAESEPHSTCAGLRAAEGSGLPTKQQQSSRSLKRVHGDFNARGGLNPHKESRVRTWDLQELAGLEDAWQPQKAMSAEKEEEEVMLRAHAAGGPSAAWQLPISKRGSGAGVSRSSRQPTGCRGGGSGGSDPGGGSDLLANIMCGNFGSKPSAPPAGSGLPSGGATIRVVDAQAEAARQLEDQCKREVSAADVVRRLHAAAAVDVAVPGSGARARLLPVLGPVVGDPMMAKPLLRAGMLGAVRRALQTTADGSITPSAKAASMRRALFGMIRALVPMVQAAHLRQSRGLGKLLMLIARSTSEPRAMREAATELLRTIVKES